MRKKILFATVLLVSFAASAQAPAPNFIPTNNADARRVGGDPNPTTAPIGSATLLFLGLAGGFTGVTIYRNYKNKE